jgi:hypothetical protein
MANKKILWGMLAALLALTMTLVSCGGDDDDDDSPTNPMEGVWEGTKDGFPVILTCTGSNWVIQIAWGSAYLDFIKGTFTIDGKAVTLTTTHRNSGLVQPPNWVSPTGEAAEPNTGTLSDDGKSITFPDMTLTKK